MCFVNDELIQSTKAEYLADGNQVLGVAHDLVPAQRPVSTDTSKTYKRTVGR
jgi:hypothetical protein